MPELTTLAKLRIHHAMTPLEWIRYDTAENKSAFVTEFCSEKLKANSANIRRMIKTIFNHMVKMYDTNTIYKGQGDDRFIASRRNNRLRLVC